MRHTSSPKNIPKTGTIFVFLWLIPFDKHNLKSSAKLRIATELCTLPHGNDGSYLRWRHSLIGLALLQCFLAAGGFCFSFPRWRAKSYGCRAFLTASSLFVTGFKYVLNRLHGNFELQQPCTAITIHKGIFYGWPSLYTMLLEEKIYNNRCETSNIRWHVCIARSF